MKATLIALIAAALFVATGSVPAQAAPPAVGSPVQLAAPNGCIAAVQAGACSADPFGSFQRALGLEITSDGLDVYVANQSGDIGRFRRDPATNVLTPAGVSQTTGIGVEDVGVSASGVRLAAVSGDTSGNGRFEWFSRNATTGALTGVSCADEDVVSGCTEMDGIGGANEVAFPPSGPGVYVAADWGGADGADGDALGDGSLAVLSVGPFGVLSQLRCIPAVDSNIPGDACNTSFDTPALDGVTSVVVSPDGAHVYAGGFGGIVGFNRTATGDLGSRAACILRGDGNSACPADGRLPNVSSLAMSPDGRFLYAGSFGLVTVLERNPLSGALSFVECLRSVAASPCPGVAGFTGAEDIAVSPDGNFVYTVTPGSAHGYVQALRRDRATGKLTPLGCISDTGGGSCAAGAGLLWAKAVAVSGDGRGVYAIAYEGTGTGDYGALTAYGVEAAPACQDATVAAAAGADAVLPLTCSDADGDSITRKIVAGPSSGSLGPVDDGAGTVTYTAAAGSSRSDTVVFSASDGTNDAAPATVTINVTGTDAPASTAASGPIATPTTSTPSAAPDGSAPHARIARIPRRTRASKIRSFRGTASDAGSGVVRVELALIRLNGKARPAATRTASCNVLTARGGLARQAAKRGVCAARRFIPANGTGRWTLKLRKPLPRGRYVLYARAIDRAGNVERLFTTRLGNRRAFRLR
jgi:6-phosphogluconolactonase (cycloisomerase 2 family)